MRRRTSPRWALAIGGVIIVAGLLWLAAPAIVTAVVRSTLRDAGFAQVSISGTALRPQGLRFDRVQLGPGEAFVLEDVLVSVASDRITAVSVGRLYLESEFDTDSGFVLPGFEVGANGPGSDLVDLVPEDGLRIADAELHVATPWQDFVLTSRAGNLLRDSTERVSVTGEFAISGESAGRTNIAQLLIGGTTAMTLGRGGVIEARLEITEGSIDAAGIRAAGLSGVAAATRAPGSAPVFELALTTAETQFAAMVFGPLRLTAGLRENVAELAVSSSASQAADLVVDARALLTDSGPLIDVTGRAAFKEPTRGELAFELNGVSLSERAASGALRVTGNGLEIPGVLRDGAIDMAATIEGNADRLRLEATDAWTATFVPADGVVPAAMQAIHGQPVSLRVGPRSSEPLELIMAWRQATADLDAMLEARAGAARVELAGRIAASWANDLSVRIAALAASVADLPLGTLTVGIEAFDGLAEYRAARWDVTGAGAVNATGRLGELALSGLTAQWSGTLAGTPAGFTAQADRCVSWDIERIQWRTVHVEGLTPPCLTAADGLLLEYDSTTGRYAVEAASGTADLRVAFTNDAAPDDRTARAYTGEISGTWPAMRLSADFESGNDVDVDLDIDDGALRLAAPGIAVAGLDGAATISAGAVESWSLSAEALESLAQTPWWAPVTVEASGEREGDMLNLQAWFSDSLGTFVVEATGTAQAGRGALDLVLYPLELISGATELADISPLLAEYAPNATGMVAFEGSIGWDGSDVASTGRLNLEGFGATLAGIPVRGLSTQTRFVSLWPLATQPEQVAEIASLSLGMPLENGVAVFDFDAEGRVAIHGLSFELAGGRIHADAFTIDSAAGSDIDLRLEVEDIELARMLELSKINGLQGTGVLSGSIPMRISGRNVHFDGGRLDAGSTGNLRYTPDSLPAFLRGDDQRTQMLREALTNFQYDALSVTVSGDSIEGGQQTVRFDALGANPDFLDGHPIELAFTFTGPLLGAMSSASSVAGAAEINDLYEQQQLNNSENSQ